MSGVEGYRAVLSVSGLLQEMHLSIHWCFCPTLMPSGKQATENGSFMLDDSMLIEEGFIKWSTELASQRLDVNWLVHRIISETVYTPGSPWRLPCAGRCPSYKSTNSVCPGQAPCVAWDAGSVIILF